MTVKQHVHDNLKTSVRPSIGQRHRKKVHSELWKAVSLRLYKNLWKAIRQIDKFLTDHIHVSKHIGIQEESDQFYSNALRLLNQCYYPEHNTAVTSRDPQFANPAKKASLHRKND